MRYRLMTDYSADWPFWGGKGDAGLCADGDPALPEETAAAARAWSSQFNELFDWQRGWAQCHDSRRPRSGGKSALRKGQALPGHEIVLQYWERAHRAST